MCREDLALPESRIKISQQSHLKKLQILRRSRYLCILKVEPDPGQGIEAFENDSFAEKHKEENVGG